MRQVLLLGRSQQSVEQRKHGCDSPQRRLESGYSCEVLRDEDRALQVRPSSAP